MVVLWPFSGLICKSHHPVKLIAQYASFWVIFSIHQRFFSHKCYLIDCLENGRFRNPACSQDMRFDMNIFVTRPNQIGRIHFIVTGNQSLSVFGIFLTFFATSLLQKMLPDLLEWCVLHQLQTVLARPECDHGVHLRWTLGQLQGAGCGAGWLKLNAEKRLNFKPLFNSIVYA